MSPAVLDRPATIAPAEPITPTPTADPNIITINVTQRHIDNGARADGLNCALALAIKEQLGETVAVGREYVWLADAVTKQYRMSAAATDFVDWFDTDRPSVTPTQLTLTRI